MEQNLWPAIRSKTTMYLFYQHVSSEEHRRLEALQLQLKEKQEAKARLLREDGDNNAEIEILESEMRTIEEAIEQKKCLCETRVMKAIAKQAKLESKIESFSTSKWVRITHSADLTAIEIMKKRFPTKKFRFCLGRKARSVEAIQQIAGYVGIGVMDVGTLYELSDGKFNVVSEAECRILHFRKWT